MKVKCIRSVLQKVYQCKRQIFSCVETFPKEKYPSTNLTSNFLTLYPPILIKQNYSS